MPKYITLTNWIGSFWGYALYKSEEKREEGVDGNKARHEQGIRPGGVGIFGGYDG